MNQEKAKEFFSSYYEGSLEPGLVQALEQAMQRDANLRADYRNFENTYEELGNLKYETIEIPFDLEDRIAARIDRQNLERRNEKQPVWTLWLRNFAVAGICCVAILGAALSIRNLKGTAAGASFVPSAASAQDEISVEPTPNHAATVHFAPANSQTLTIKEGLNGPDRSRMPSDGAEITTTLENPTVAATAFELETTDDSRPTLIAIPGSTRSAATKGGGNMEAFAKALADHYNVPVEVHAAHPTVNLNWEFKAANPADAAKSVLDVTLYNIDWRANGLLVISESAN